MKFRQIPEGEVRLHRLLERTENLLRDSVPDGEVQEVTPISGEALSWYARLRSLFSAARLLIREGYPEEASILARSLFEGSLKLELLADVRERERERLVLGAVNAGLDRFIGIFHDDNIALGLGDGLTADERERIETRRRQIAARQRRLGLGRLARFPDDKTLAIRFDRREEYQGLRLSSEVTHGSHLAQATRSRHPNLGEVAVFHRNYDLRMLVGVGSFAALAALRATIALSTWLPFVSGAGVSELVDEIDGFDREVTNSTDQG